MILRDYQKEAVKNTKEALIENNNTLIVAPTGAGKTIILSALINELVGVPKTEDLFGLGKTVILQHRLELVKQNSEKFTRVNPDFLLRTSILTGREKDASGDVVFATVQTLSTSSGLKKIPRLDYLFIDEAHHSVAETYTDTIDYYRNINPNLKVIGLTATADRADEKGLGDVFNNVAFKIDTDLLIEMGFLVPPDSYVMDIGLNDEIDELGKKKKRMSENVFNKALSGIYKPFLPRIEEEWVKKASNRHTICFCTTIDEAESLCHIFQEKGHKAGVVHSKMHYKDVRLGIDRFHSGKIQILFNVAILVEGFDCSTVNCVILTRSCSAKSTMIQMVGRGLRPIVDEKDQWMEKTDCLVLDFGDSLKTHGTLRSDVNIEKIKESGTEKAIQLQCPHCQKMIIVLKYDMFCPRCGVKIVDEIDEAEKIDSSGPNIPGKISLKNFNMVPIDLTHNSPFAWVDILSFFPNIKETIMCASGFYHSVAMKEIDEGIWVAIGIPQKGLPVHLGTARERIAFAHCNNYLSSHETTASAKKQAYWHFKPASVKQFKLLSQLGWNASKGDNPPDNCYQASVMISFIKSYKKYHTIVDGIKTNRKVKSEGTHRL